MPWYRTEDGKGTFHIDFGRGRRGVAGPLPCLGPARPGDDLVVSKRCCRISVALCDAPAGKDLAGNPLTCDMPLCEGCCTRGGTNVDYCPRHKHLAPPALPLGAAS